MVGVTLTFPLQKNPPLPCGAASRKSSFNHLLYFYSTRSQASAEYWIQFTARFGGFHAFDYNSAAIETIRMKSGALMSTLLGASPGRIWARSAQYSDSWRAKKNVFCEVSNARFHRFAVGQIAQNLNTIYRSMR